MQNVRFIKEPGYLYDLYFVFVLHFNKDYCLKYFINGSKAAADTEFFNKILREYEAIPRDLLPFFYLKGNSLCFMSQYYFNNCGRKLIEGYDLAAVQEDIGDHKQVVLNLIQFYFPDADLEAIHSCDNVMAIVGKMIKESEYNDSVKSALYAFFVDPDAMIQKLYYELMKKDYQLSQQYDKAGILEVQQRFDLKKLNEKWGQYKDHICNTDDFEMVYVTFCELARTCLRYELFEDSCLLILGTDYMASLDDCLLQSMVPELDIIGNALAEKNRVDILELIWEKGEITIKDIEQTLKFTGTNSYYHLSLMIRAKLVHSRTQGRTVLYSINEQCFEAVREMLKKFTEKRGEKI